jgi:TolB-like protein/tetratricopeptide (TPR) repeat protein
MAISSGTILGPYEIVGPLGAGGMGEVYRARDERLQRDVAVKVLPAAVAGDPARLGRFEREARALAQLSHPAILSIFDFGKEGEISYAVTELLEGETLRERLGREQLSWRRAVEVATAIADGLASAHAAGIVHRDLKPENIFLTRDGRVKILDFGLARTEPVKPVGPGTLSLTPADTLPGTLLGTVGYMAPEQVRGEPADARSDIFALGCILFEMLTGKRAFGRDTAAETMTAILKEPVPEMKLSAAEVSPELDCIIGHCLEKSPAERFQSAGDLAFNLREVAKSEVRAARAVARKRGRPRAAWIILAALLVLAGAVLIWKGGAFLAPRGASGPSEGERVAVLPFENLGASDDAYFAAGVTDEITGRLASVRGLAVVSRASAIQYAGTTKSTREIASELGVKYLLTGTVRWARAPGAAERVRITPQLIRGADDTSLWGQVYEFDMDDIFGVQSEIAGSVVSQLGLALLDDERGSLEARPTGNLEAYQAFLRGRFLAGQAHFTLATWLDAVGDFERAVALDPSFTLAWAELSKAHARLVYFRYDISPQRHREAETALARARELAPSSPEVRLAAGYYHLWVERDTEAALGEFEAASRGLPNHAELEAAKGELFRLHGDWQRSLDSFRAARSISPRDGSLAVEVAETLWWMRRYPEAYEASNQAIALAPDQVWAYLTKVFVLWSWKGRDGLGEARAVLELVPKEHEWAEWTLFWQEALGGRYAEAISRMEESPEDWIRIKIQAGPKVYFAAVIQSSIGETERARKGFEAAIRLLEAEVQAKPDDGRYHSSLGVAFAGLGRREQALREGERGVELLPLSKDAVYGISHVIDLAHIYTLLSETGKAVEQLEVILTQPGWVSVPWLRMDPRWRPLQGDPSFEALLAKHENLMAAPLR